jgi:1-acyl-sn-glycerol-3-phosphate acyltransferase
MNFWYLIRSAVFWLVFATNTILFGLISPIFLLLPFSARQGYARFYSQLNTFLLRIICGVKPVIIGREHIPYDQNFVIMANHQSTWETLAFASIFPNITWVLKRELLNIPFFGWGLRTINPIAINRSAGKSAIEQVKLQGKKRLDQGINIVIFPEGTRVAPRSKGNYKKGGGLLVKHADVNILPVAHNAGDCWPREQFIKKPGIIYLHIGELICTKEMDENRVIEAAKTWIQSEQDIIAKKVDSA